MKTLLKNELIEVTGLDSDDSPAIALAGLSVTDFAEQVPSTDDSLVKIIAELLTGLLTYDSEAKQWYVWNGKIHQQINEGLSLIVAKDYALYLLEDIHAEFWEKHRINPLADDADDEAKKTHQDKIALLNKAVRGVRYMINRLGFSNGQDAFLKMIRRELDITPDQRQKLEEHSTQFWAFENGVLDMADIPRAIELNNGQWEYPMPELLPHSKDRFIFTMTPHNFSPDAQAPNWAHFMSDDSFVNNGEAYFMEQVLGIGMSGQVAKFKKYAVSLQGVTNSGKSMIAEVLQGIYGKEYVVRAKKSIVSTTRGDGTEQNRQRLAIKDARLVFVSECTSNIDESFVLEYSGGDPYDVRKMGTDPQTVKPKGMLVMTSNDGLKMDKSKPQLFDRLMPVHMPYRRTELIHSDFWAQDDPNISGPYFRDADGTINKPMDAELAEKLIDEAEGITIRLIRAFQHAKAQRPMKTDSMFQRLNSEKMGADVFWIFIHEHASLSRFDETLTLNQSVRVRDLYAQYKELAQDFFQKPMDLARFSKRLNGTEDAHGNVMQTKASNGSRLVGYTLTGG